MVNSVDPDQTVLIWLCTGSKDLSVRVFRVSTVQPDAAGTNYFASSSW